MLQCYGSAGLAALQAPMIDVRKLRYFATVAELGSFTRAANLLGVAQPAISRQVQQLEQELGLDLLLREGRQISLTDAGAALLRHAHTIDRDFERLVEDMQARKGSPMGRVVIGIPPTLADTLVPRLGERAGRDYPMITLKIAEGVTPVLFDWVENNRVDFAVISLGIVADREQGPSLKLERLTSEDMIIVERVGSAEPVRVYSLSRMRAKLLILSDMLATIVRHQLGQPNLNFNVAVEIDAVQAIKVLVLAGKAASILPVSMVSRELHSGLVTGAAITSKGVRRELALAQPRYRQMTRAAEAVNALVKQETATLEAEGAFSLDRARDRPAV
jgi:LysR family nitrogen assimilation transcriptional regulator